jgi:hypothetical protein
MLRKWVYLLIIGDSVVKAGTEFFLDEMNASLIWPYKKRNK